MYVLAPIVIITSQQIFLAEDEYNLYHDDEIILENSGTDKIVCEKNSSNIPGSNPRLSNSPGSNLICLVIEFCLVV